jgi:hypothetical protein
MNLKFKKKKEESGAVAQAHNLSYLEGLEWEDHSLRPAQAKSSGDHIS